MHNLGDHVVMVPHPRPVVDACPTEGLLLHHQLAEVDAVLIVRKDRATVDPAIHQVITQRTLIDSSNSWHAQNASESHNVR